MTELQTLYPPIEPYQTHHLKVDSLHQIYIEECGNPNGVPILYIHGGPGSGCSPDSRRFFNPKIYRIILFDQRGAGQSLPHAELKDNTTQHLINDMEQIRHYLKIEQWLLFGGSWGSTLALVYAQVYPHAVLGFILRGIFLARSQDLDWLYNELRGIFPDRWQDFMAPLPKNTPTSGLINAYYNLLTHSDPKIRLTAAKAWAAWEVGSLTVQPRPDIMDKFAEDETALSFARIECHYMHQQCFLAPNQILLNMAKIKHLPAIIVHGRLDLVCLPENAWSLHQAWPNSELEYIEGAGHSSSEPGIADGLIRATRKMGEQFIKAKKKSISS